MVEVMSVFEGVQARENAVEVCGPRTGHAVRAVAFCDSGDTASELVAAVKRDAEGRKHLATVLAFARLKWGNLDPDANKAFEAAEAFLER